MRNEESADCLFSLYVGQHWYINMNLEELNISNNNKKDRNSRTFIQPTSQVTEDYNAPRRRSIEVCS